MDIIQLVGGAAALAGAIAQLFQDLPGPLDVAFIGHHYIAGGEPPIAVQGTAEGIGPTGTLAVARQAEAP